MIPLPLRQRPDDFVREQIKNKYDRKWIPFPTVDWLYNYGRRTRKHRMDLLLASLITLFQATE